MEDNVADEVSITRAGGVVVLKYTGYVDSETFGILRDALENLIKQGACKIVVDLSVTTFMSSAGWGTIVGNLKKTKENGGNIVLAAMSEEVQSVYELVEFNELIKSYVTVEAAIKSF
jgi:anti-sigma B factor antagonist